MAWELGYGVMSTCKYINILTVFYTVPQCFLEMFYGGTSLFRNSNISIMNTGICFSFIFYWNITVKWQILETQFATNLA